MKKQSDKSRCEIRAFEVIYDDATPQQMEAILKKLCSKQYGIYKAFLIRHTEDKKSHIHCGIILRDKPTKLYWKGVKEYFTVCGFVPREHGPLKNKSKKFDVKLQTYFNYCIDQDKHPGQIIGKPLLHKWKPAMPEDNIKPDDFLVNKIRAGMTVDELEELIDNPDTDIKIYKQALKQFDVYEKMITKHEEIREKKRDAVLYREMAEEYRPFQAGLTKILDEQDDRNIHNHFDEGRTGKNYWLDREGMRPDTLVIQSADTKRIAYAWDHKKHKRIIIDIPKGKAEYLNTSAIEKLKNGFMFSTMHRPKPKRSTFKPAIVIISNEMVDSSQWTSDRATFSSTSKKDGYQLKMMKL